MCGTECVTDVIVDEGCELLDDLTLGVHKHVALGGLAVDRPHVSEEEDLPGLCLGDRFHRLIAEDVVDIPDGGVDVLGEMLRMLLQVDEVPFTLPALMGQHDDLGLLSHELPDGGHDPPDPGVVDDLQLGLVQGTVDVHPQEDGLVPEIEISERVEVLGRAPTSECLGDAEGGIGLGPGGCGILLDLAHGPYAIDVLGDDIGLLVNGLVVVQGVADDLDAVLPDDDLVHVGPVASEVPCELHDLGGGLDTVLALHEPDTGSLLQDVDDLLGGGLGGELCDDGVDVHQGGGGLDRHCVDVQPGHDALHIGSVMGGQFDGGLKAVDGSVLAVTGIGGTPDDGYEGLLDLELLVDGVQGSEESGGVA